MSTRMSDLFTGGFGELRHEPTAKRIRAVLGQQSCRRHHPGLAGMGTRRIVRSYAVPGDDVTAELVPADPAAADAGGHHRRPDPRAVRAARAGPIGSVRGA